MHLLAAPMLAGLILASVPILIHLWNRRRFKLVEWAPMKYLKLTIQTNRRRMRIEQLLLLAVRVLVVALLFAALARPALSRTGIGSWVASQSRASRIIVIDDSMSMGYQSGRQSAFDQARDAAIQILHSIGAQDGITVVLASRPDQPLVREGSTESPNLLRDIQNLRAADSACDWASVFKQIDSLVVGAAHLQRELILITDLRRSGWNAGVSAQIARWAGQSFEVKIVDVGSRDTANTVLTRFEQEDALALPGMPLKLRASIRNDSGALLHQATGTLEIDGQSRPVPLPELRPGQTTDLPLTITLAASGQHVLKLSLPNDALSADNSRWLSVSVRPDVKIAIIDGQVVNRPFESSTDFFQVALTAGVEAWMLNRRSDLEWPRAAVADAQLSNADVIVLSNVASLSPQHVTILEKLVAAGRGLMIFPGDQVDAAVYNQLLYRDGAGLLPARMAPASDAAPNGLTIEALADSPLAPMSKIAPEALSRIHAKKFLSVAIDEGGKDKNSRVLARWNDSEAHPAAIEKRFGHGRVILWTVTADRQWSDWPIDPTYVLAMRSAASAIVRPEPAGTNFTAGEEIIYPLDEGQVVQNPLVTGPDQSLVQQPLTIADQVLRYPHTPRAGKYTLTWKDAAGVEQSRALAASFNPAESNLQPISESELANLLSPVSPTFVHWGTVQGNDSLAEHGREIWRNLIFAVLALAAIETVLATWVGRER
ncbi:MAG TPA: BatA domain-containing protein [Humisphaera sp.]|jgi:hypothetical protein|nr:BatA domain-containing protein [Humisphaera sp.]